MTEKKYYRTVIHFEILSDEPVPDTSDLLEIYELTMDGPMSGHFLETTEEIVTEERMAELLHAQGSDPTFLIDDNEEEHDHDQT